MEGKEIGLLVLTAIALIVGAILLQGSAQNLSPAIDTRTVTNYSVTNPVTNGFVYLHGQKVIGTPVIINGTSGVGSPNSSVFTFGENVSSTTGVKTIYIKNNGYPTWGGAGQLINITYDYGDFGYVEDSGGRAVAGVIIILFALGIGVAALYPTLKEWGGYR